MNFIHVNRPHTDMDKFFGPLEPEDKFEVFDDTMTMADLVVKLGNFPSKTMARKNGWGADIPLGFSTHKCGKTHFWVLR